MKILSSAIPPPRLAMTGVQKRFGATHALRGVELEVAPGEVHALLGENGAGKSTLMKILSGAITPDEGRIAIDGRPFSPTDPLHARAQGVVMIYQELNLAPQLSVAENIVLGSEPTRFGWIDRRRRDGEAARVLSELDHGALPLNEPVYRLSVAEQQVVEIARALRYDARLLIMDEPTSSLTRADVEKLFAVIRRLRERGVSIVYISHFLEECREVADRFTVMRDGQTVGTGRMAAVEEPALVRMMVGRDLGEIYPQRSPEIGEPVLELRELRGQPKPTSVSLTLHQGEILGIAGLVGAGRTEMLRACFGLAKVKGGAVFVLGRESTHARTPQRLAQGFGFLSEDRKEEGLMLNQSVADNLTLTRLGPFTRGGFIRESRQRAIARDWIEKLAIRTQGPAQAVYQLSGGNQQKVAIGRLLHHDARILLLDEPTRGIDVGSKAQIYRLIVALAAAGKAIIFVSSYLPELLGICDTIGVMSRGRLVALRPAAEWTEESILSAAIGHEAA
jgi:ribose transport system ATP-binding protein